MCGRFEVDTMLVRELEEMVREIRERNPNVPVKTGEIFPTEFAPMMAAVGGETEAAAGKWGFAGVRPGRVIINAKAETVTEKPIFRESFLTRRCALPCSGYYEWDRRTRQKYLIRDPDAPLIYLAGCYKIAGGEKRFVVLTTEANDSVGRIHFRMPVILRENFKEDWLHDDFAALNYYKTDLPSLQCEPVGPARSAGTQLSMF